MLFAFLDQRGVDVVKTIHMRIKYSQLIGWLRAPECAGLLLTSCAMLCQGSAIVVAQLLASRARFSFALTATPRCTGPRVEIGLRHSVTWICEFLDFY